MAIPEISLSSGNPKSMPVLGLGLGASDPTPELTDNYGDRVFPALQKSLQEMKLDYLDQYLIHFPLTMKAGSNPFRLNPENCVAMDIEYVWTAMEECQRLGLTKSIGVSNFSCKKLDDILAFAKIPPAINQQVPALKMNIWITSLIGYLELEMFVCVTLHLSFGNPPCLMSSLSMPFVKFREFARLLRFFSTLLMHLKLKLSTKFQAS
ncbi:hypothetical protein POM88_011033 [Heracleum sosnowskyi]|uniref:NADP-dependent oxidoreductase domain-containing protein n=1 Tax=Heracleum sosnowskyi TaxID=360622 RepID=A0AAD8IX71_9APIA|nr:hypothetical protein POM88_011033 [Heracleum sosnowskyi]